MRVSDRDRFQLAFSQAYGNYLKDLDAVGFDPSPAESRASFVELWSGSSDMNQCALDDTKRPAKYKGGYAWCGDHDMPATHCGTDGDTPVCVFYAQAVGCNCCFINYDPKLRSEVMKRFGKSSHHKLPDKKKRELLYRVRVILDDVCGIGPTEAQELINELQRSGIEFREVEGG